MTEKNTPPATGRSRKHKGRHAARLAAVQALYQWDQAPITADELIAEFIEHRLNQGPDENHDIKVDQDYFSGLVSHTIENQESIDQIVKETLPKSWPFLRLDAVLRAILRVGCDELINDKPLTAAIIINEYVNITHEFFSGKEPGFINGMLDHIAQKLGVTMRDDKTVSPKQPPHEIENFLKEHETTEEVTWEDEGGGST